MLSYRKLVSFLYKQKHFPVNSKPAYIVITIPKTRYHITIFADQWDDYQKVTNMPYYLFHISSDDTIQGATSGYSQDRCSSYFWVRKTDLNILPIPSKYFKYSQPDFDFYKSTRNPCNYNDISPIVGQFQNLLHTIKYVEYFNFKI
jgi:hypothetical protein